MTISPNDLATLPSFDRATWDEFEVWYQTQPLEVQALDEVQALRDMGLRNPLTPPPTRDDIAVIIKHNEISCTVATENRAKKFADSSQVYQAEIEYTAEDQELNEYLLSIDPFMRDYETGVALAAIIADPQLTIQYLNLHGLTDGRFGDIINGTHVMVNVDDFYLCLDTQYTNDGVSLNEPTYFRDSKQAFDTLKKESLEFYDKGAAHIEKLLKHNTNPDFSVLNLRCFTAYLQGAVLSADQASKNLRGIVDAFCVARALTESDCLSIVANMTARYKDICGSRIENNRTKLQAYYEKNGDQFAFDDFTFLNEFSESTQNLLGQVMKDVPDFLTKLSQVETNRYFLQFHEAVATDLGDIKTARDEIAAITDVNDSYNFVLAFPTAGDQILGRVGLTPELVAEAQRQLEERQYISVEKRNRDGTVAGWQTTLQINKPQGVTEEQWQLALTFAEGKANHESWEKVKIAAVIGSVVVACVAAPFSAGTSFGLPVAIGATTLGVGMMGLDVYTAQENLTVARGNYFADFELNGFGSRPYVEVMENDRDYAVAAAVVGGSMMGISLYSQIVVRGGTTLTTMGWNALRGGGEGLLQGIADGRITDIDNTQARNFFTTGQHDQHPYTTMVQGLLFTTIVGGVTGGVASGVGEMAAVRNGWRVSGVIVDFSTQELSVLAVRDGQIMRARVIESDQASGRMRIVFDDGVEALVRVKVEPRVLSEDEPKNPITERDIDDVQIDDGPGNQKVQDEGEVNPSVIEAEMGRETISQTLQNWGGEVDFGPPDRKISLPESFFAFVDQMIDQQLKKYSVIEKGYRREDLLADKELLVNYSKSYLLNENVRSDLRACYLDNIWKNLCELTPGEVKIFNELGSFLGNDMLAAQLLGHQGINISTLPANLYGLMARALSYYQTEGGQFDPQWRDVLGMRFNPRSPLLVAEMREIKSKTTLGFDGRVINVTMTESQVRDNVGGQVIEFVVVTQRRFVSKSGDESMPIHFEEGKKSEYVGRNGRAEKVEMDIYSQDLQQFGEIKNSGRGLALTKPGIEGSIEFKPLVKYLEMMNVDIEGLDLKHGVFDVVVWNNDLRTPETVSVLDAVFQECYAGKNPLKEGQSIEIVFWGVDAVEGSIYLRETLLITREGDSLSVVRQGEGREEDITFYSGENGLPDETLTAAQLSMEGI